MMYVYPFGQADSLYTEKPVDIMTFIKNNYFLGKFTNNGDRIYPFWKDVLKMQGDLNCAITCFATATNTGKTLNSMIFAIYRLYQIMCLQSINGFYQFDEHDLSTFVFATVNKRDMEYIRSMFLRIISESDWFIAHGRIDNRDYIPNNKNLTVEYISSEDHCYGKQIIGFYFHWLCDKFNGYETVNLYNQLSVRVISRTSVGGVLYGKGVVDLDVASSYLNWNNKITGSQWEVKPYGTFDMSKVFGIVTNGVKGKSKIVEFNNGVTIDIPEDYNLIIVPYQLLNDAKLSLDIFLNNFAGIHLREDKEDT